MKNAPVSQRVWHKWALAAQTNSGGSSDVPSDVSADVSAESCSLICEIIFDLGATSLERRRQPASQPEGKFDFSTGLKVTQVIEGAPS